MGNFCPKIRKADADNKHLLKQAEEDQTTLPATSLQQETKDGRPAPSKETPSSTSTPKSQESIKKPTTQSPPSSTPRDKGTITPTLHEPAKEDTNEKPTTESSPSSTTEDNRTLTPTLHEPAKKETNEKPTTKSSPSSTPGQSTPTPPKRRTKKRPSESSLFSSTADTTSTPKTQKPVIESSEERSTTSSPSSTTGNKETLTPITQEPAKEDTNKKPTTEPTPSSTTGDNGTSTATSQEQGTENTEVRPTTVSSPSSTTGDNGTSTPTIQEPAKENTNKKPTSESSPSSITGDNGTSTPTSQEPAKEDTNKDLATKSSPSSTTGDKGTSTPTSQEPTKEDTNKDLTTESISYSTPGDTKTSTTTIQEPGTENKEVRPTTVPTPSSTTGDTKTSTTTSQEPVRHITENENVKSAADPSSSSSLPQVIDGTRDPTPNIPGDKEPANNTSAVILSSEDDNGIQDPQPQDMANKIRMIRDFLSGGSQQKTSQEIKNSPRRIFLIQESTPSAGIWLENLLGPEYKVDLQFTKISKMEKHLSKEKATNSIYCILHFSKKTFQKNLTPKNSSKIDGKILNCFGKHNNLQVIVVVDDLEEKDSEEELRAQYDRCEFRKRASLFMFRRKDITEYMRNVSPFSEKDKTTQDKETKHMESKEKRLERSESSEKSDPQTLTPVISDEKTRIVKNLGTVGIFSRSSNTDYSWMEKLLRSDLSPYVSTVRPFIISNNQTLQFFEELQLCKFGILYHTKNRGRVNVTDVTDSLYDEELETMSAILGRDHVLVVIDDLQDSRTEEKDRILDSQPSIKKYSRNLLLVTEQEKKDKKIILERLREALLSPGI